MLGAILPDIKQTLERPPDHLLQQERVGVKEIFPNHDGSRRLDEVVLFDERDELARTGLLRFEVKRRRKNWSRQWCRFVKPRSGSP